MFGIILLIIAILLVWKLSVRGPRFVQGFALLLERPVRHSRNLWSLVAGTDQVDGEYEGRLTVLRLQQRRGKYTLGYLILSMEGLRPILSGDASAFPDSIRDSDGRRALYDLTVKYDVTLAHDGRWLKGTWMPVGFMIFPGRFEPERWRNVLRAMRTVVRSLEGDVSPTV